MNHRFACLTVAALALAAAPDPGMSAAPVRNPSGEIDILVDGVPQRRYAHDGRWYVEALKGREYAIRLRNPFAVRVAVALSVDGLNTIDARQTTAADARKWVLGRTRPSPSAGGRRAGPRRAASNSRPRHAGSGQALGKTANLGVITAVFFKERTSAIVSGTSNDEAGRRAGVPESPARLEQEAPAAASRSGEADEYAATGMGRRTDHAVTQVWLDLEDAPVQIVNIRYEFRPQLVRLGILSPAPAPDPLQRRERARGFEAGFSPEPPVRSENRF